MNRLTAQDLERLYRAYPDVFETWAQGSGAHGARRALEGAQAPRDPWGPSISDRDIDRARRNTPGIVIYDEPPLEDVSNGQAILQGDASAEICRVKYRSCQELTAAVRVFPPQSGSYAVASGSGNVTATDVTDPFNDLLTTAAMNLPPTIPQTTEVIGYLSVAHQNNSFEIPFNMPLGQIMRVQTVGSYMALRARLTARYTPKLGAGALFSWLVDPAGSNFERNNAFDNPPSLSAFVLNQPHPIRVEGYCGKAFSAPVPPTRIFFGWTDASLAAGAVHLCPVPRGAQTVLLKCDGSNDDFTGANLGVRHAFYEICQSPGAGTFRPLLNQPSNTTIRLSADCSAIAVVNIDATPVGNTPRWELIYDVGF